MNDDVLCIEQFLGGNDAGFEALVRKYQDRVLNIVYSLVGRDRESEDIAQESFLKVYHKLGSFQRRSQFSTWLYRIVVNTTYDFLRRRRHFVSDTRTLENTMDHAIGPQEALARKERDAMVQAALLRLPLKMRTAVVLKDIEGLSYAEIAGIIGCSIGTVESRIYRARQALKEKVLELGGEAL